jgi:hypothetical protein
MKLVHLAATILVVASPSAFAEDKADAWYPRTEKVAPDEMFIVALGTGMPTPITRAQKSAAWYVELGNGDIFLFDVGTGSAENLFALRPDFARVDKAFASHLHTDHVGDVDALWIGGWLSGDMSRSTSTALQAPNRNSAPQRLSKDSSRRTRGTFAGARAHCPTTAAN